MSRYVSVGSTSRLVEYHLLKPSPSETPGQVASGALALLVRRHRRLRFIFHRLHWQGEGEPLLFLEALLRQESLRKIPRVAYESRYRLSCRDGWGTAERARFREETPARDRGRLEGRDHEILCALASGLQQDCSHGAGGIHGALHAGMVGLRDCG